MEGKMSIDMSMTNLVIHVDETLDAQRRDSLLAAVREAKGVIAVGYHNETPHLLIVVFNRKNLTALDVLSLARSSGVHAELTGG
jgi:hypothetical protein